MNLNEIIERKKEEFDNKLRHYGPLNELTEDDTQATWEFLERAIRESVEEALREIGYSEKVERECGCWGNGRTSDYHLEKDCPGKLREYTRFDSKVKEFMK